MDTKVGRNDPCPCGSGKKYKKCHLLLEAAPTSAPTQSAPSLPIVPGGPERSAPLPLPLVNQPAGPLWTGEGEVGLEPGGGHQEEHDAFWARFDAGDAAGQRAILDEVIAEDPHPDVIFDIVDSMRRRVADAGSRAWFADTIAHIRIAAPDAYATDELWYLSWLIEDAVTDRAYDRLPALVPDLAAHAGDSIDEFLRLMDMLMFHDRLDLVVETMARAWDDVSSDPEITPHGVARFAATLAMLQLFRHLRRGGRPTTADRALRNALRPLGEVAREHINEALVVLASADLPRWTADDFRHDHGPEGGDREHDDDHAPEGAHETCETLERNVYLLSLGWARWLEQEHGVPMPRTELAREMLTEMVLDAPPLDEEGHAPLLPAPDHAGRFLQTLLSPLSGLYYQAGTLFALLPRYIEFLEDRGLAGHEEARRARAAVLEQRPEVLRIVSEAVPDPALHALIRDAGWV